MPVVSIRHVTRYRYRKPVAFGEHRVLYRPLESHDQRLISAALEVTPEAALLRHAHDVSGTTAAVARFDAKSAELTFESRVSLRHIPLSPFDLEDEAARLGAGAFTYHRDDAPELARCIARAAPDDAATAEWARQFRPYRRKRPLSDLLSEMTQAIRGNFAYRLRLEGGPQTAAETLERRSGSCRDFAVLMIEAARSLGLAARFVSGYVYSSRTYSGPAGRTGGGHTHAWVQVYIPGCGWVDFDPTNGIVGNTDLIRVTCVADPRLAIPLHGAWKGGRSDFLGMDVEVDVQVGADAAQPGRPLRVARGP